MQVTIEFIQGAALLMLAEVWGQIPWLNTLKTSTFVIYGLVDSLRIFEKTQEQSKVSLYPPTSLMKSYHLTCVFCCYRTLSYTSGCICIICRVLNLKEISSVSISNEFGWTVGAERRTISRLWDNRVQYARVH